MVRRVEKNESRCAWKWEVRRRFAGCSNTPGTVLPTLFQIVYLMCNFISQLEREYARLLPALKNLVEKEKEKGKMYKERSQNLGFSQAFEYGERSNVEC